MKRNIDRQLFVKHAQTTCQIFNAVLATAAALLVSCSALREMSPWSKLGVNMQHWNVRDTTVVPGGGECLAKLIDSTQQKLK